MAVFVVGSTATIAPPNDASETKTFDVPGMTAEPNKTAVPEGELRVSLVARLDGLPHFPPWTGKTEKNPVLFFVGSPLTVAKSLDSSVETNSGESVFGEGA